MGDERVVRPRAVTTILMPLALAPVPDALRTVVVDEARAFGAGVVLLHVLPTRAAPRDGGVCQVEAAAHAFLGTVAARLGEAGVRARLAVRFGPTALFPGERSADLVARLADLGDARPCADGRRASWEEALDRLAADSVPAPAASGRVGALAA
jgi:hypothetical protein